MSLSRRYRVATASLSCRCRAAWRIRCRYVYRCRDGVKRLKSRYVLGILMSLALLSCRSRRNKRHLIRALITNVAIVSLQTWAKFGFYFIYYLPSPFPLLFSFPPFTLALEVSPIPFTLPYTYICLLYTSPSPRD